MKRPRFVEGLKQGFAHLILRPGDKCLIKVRNGAYKEGRAVIVQPDYAVLRMSGYAEDQAQANHKNTFAIRRAKTGMWQLVKKPAGRSAKTDRDLIASATGIPRDEIEIDKKKRLPSTALA